ncbi:MAG: DUF3795 domain-containing protein [Treponema sp.]|nr:DUF3795 domain-containing protein [Treponema sp.]
MEKIIAYCGLNCAECDAYLALQNNDQALREKTAAEWTKAHNFSFTPDMINCTSCKGAGVQVGHCSECEIRKCASEKGVINCGACGGFKTCKTINDFLVQVPFAANNLVQN